MLTFVSWIFFYLLQQECISCGDQSKMYRTRAIVSRRKKKALNGRMKIYMKAIMICICKLTICLNKRACLFISLMLTTDARIQNRPVCISAIMLDDSCLHRYPSHHLSCHPVEVIDFDYEPRMIHPLVPLNRP